MREVEPTEEISDSEPEEHEDPTPTPGKAFFDCEEDLQGTSREIFIREQQNPASKSMQRMRDPKTQGKGIIFITEPDGLLLMKHKEEDIGRIVVPESLRAYILRMHHNVQLAGHQGYRRVLEQIRDQFYWPGMKQTVIRWVRSCLACTRRKTSRPLRAGFKTPALASYPNETLVLDIIGEFHKSIGGNKWVLTMMDQFTKWPVAVAIPDRRSETIAKAIFKYWICEKGVPFRVVSDQGRELISKGMKQLCAKMGIAKKETAGYNPTGNSTIERFHRYFKASISILDEKKVADWDEYIAPILFSYRASVTTQQAFRRL